MNSVKLKIKIDGEVRLDHRVFLFIKIIIKYIKSIDNSPGDLMCVNTSLRDRENKGNLRSYKL